MTKQNKSAKTRHCTGMLVKSIEDKCDHVYWNSWKKSSFWALYLQLIVAIAQSRAKFLTKVKNCPQMSFKNWLNFGGRIVENNLQVLNTAVAEKRFRCHFFGLERHGLLRNFWWLAVVISGGRKGSRQDLTAVVQLWCRWTRVVAHQRLFTAVSWNGHDVAVRNPSVGPESDGSSSYTMICVNFG